MIDDFKRAVHSSDVAALRDMIPRRDDLRDIVDAPLFAFDSPAIVAAAGRGNVNLVDALLQLGADPNRRSDWWAGGFHALYSATGAVAERLLAAGAVPDACAAAHLDRADLLTAMLADDPARVHERGGDGQTPLHFARSRRVADLLLAAGADIDALDVDHRSTPAHWMVGPPGEGSRVDLARYLVEFGAACDIFLAAVIGDAPRVRALLERDASLLDLRTSQGDYGEKPPSSFHIYTWTIGGDVTPLQAAAHFGRTDVLDVMRRFASPQQRLLLACHLADRDAALAVTREHPGIVAQLGANDRRSLTQEAWGANAPAVALMLELGFDPAAPNSSGPDGTALHCAAWVGSADCVAALLARPAGRALISVREPMYQATPLGWCCHGSLNCHRAGANHAEVARLLIAAGATPGDDARDASAAVLAVVSSSQRSAVR